MFFIFICIFICICIDYTSYYKNSTQNLIHPGTAFIAKRFCFECKDNTNHLQNKKVIY